MQRDEQKMHDMLPGERQKSQFPACYLCEFHPGITKVFQHCSAWLASWSWRQRPGNVTEMIISSATLRRNPVVPIPPTLICLYTAPANSIIVNTLTVILGVGALLQRGSTVFRVVAKEGYISTWTWARRCWRWLFEKYYRAQSQYTSSICSANWSECRGQIFLHCPALAVGHKLGKAFY